MCFCFQSPYLSFYNPAISSHYTLSLHDALPIFAMYRITSGVNKPTSTAISPINMAAISPMAVANGVGVWRSEEHMSELQSRGHLVCRLLLEKKKLIRYCISIKNLQEYSKEQSTL